MKAIDLYAAHALGALVANSKGGGLTDDDHKALAIEARALAVTLAETICETEPCDVVWSEDIHGNPQQSRCKRCGE